MRLGKVTTVREWHRPCGPGVTRILLLGCCQEGRVDIRIAGSSRVNDAEVKEVAHGPAIDSFGH